MSQGSSPQYRLHEEPLPSSRSFHCIPHTCSHHPKQETQALFFRTQHGKSCSSRWFERVLSSISISSYPSLQSCLLLCCFGSLSVKLLRLCRDTKSMLGIWRDLLLIYRSYAAKFKTPAKFPWSWLHICLKNNLGTQPQNSRLYSLFIFSFIFLFIFQKIWKYILLFLSLGHRRCDN